MAINIADIEKRAIELALQEDIGTGDQTSLACIPSNIKGEAVLKIKETGIISGIDIAEKVLKTIDNTSVFSKLLNDGDKVTAGNTAFTVFGNAQAILKAERLLLNIMQRMSGIATKTAQYVAEISDTKTKILDTRKTAPCMRYFDKLAVAHGGGINHRFGLFDMILIKDNHVDYSGGVAQAINRVHQYLKKTGQKLPIEVEVRNLDDLKTVLEIGKIDRIMLDNFDIKNTMQAVKIIAEQIPVESSGNITISDIRDYALCGVDFI